MALFTNSAAMPQPRAANPTHVLLPVPADRATVAAYESSASGMVFLARKFLPSVNTCPSELIKLKSSRETHSRGWWKALRVRNSFKRLLACWYAGHHESYSH